MAVVERPTEVMIGHGVWRIEWTSLDDWREGNHDENADALTYARRNLIVIKLDPGSQESHYQDTIWHEINHAIWDYSMVTHYHDDVGVDNREEYVIGATSPLMVGVMKHNPKIVKWLTSDGSLILDD